MSVTFNRAQLIKVAEAALAAHTKAQRDYEKACETYRVKHAERHSNDGVRRLRDYLTAALRRGGPVTRVEAREAVGATDIERVFYDPVADYVVTRNVEAPPKLLTAAQAIETKALLEVLRAATGDTVSVNELKLLGLKNLAPVFTAAVQAASAKR